jgi:hypothetical protein
MKLNDKILTAKVKKRKGQLVLIVKIAFWHRVNIGMMRKAKFFGFLYFNQQENIRELITSPVPPEQWKYVYRIALTAEDRSGLINHIAGILHTARVNILWHDFQKNSFDGTAVFTIMINMSRALAKFHGTVAEFVETMIKIPLSNVNTQAKKGKKKLIDRVMDRRVVVTCLPNLQPNGDLALNVKLEGLIVAETEELANDFFIPLHATKKGIVLNGPLIKALDLREGSIIQYTTISDSNDRFMHIRFFPQNRYLVYLEIKHRDVPGSIHKFSEYILSLGITFNILSCYNRMESIDDVAYWNIILDVSSNPDCIDKLLDQELWNEFEQKKFGTNIEVFDINADFTQNIYSQYKREVAQIVRKNRERKIQSYLLTHLKDMLYLTIIAGLAIWICLLLKIFDTADLVLASIGVGLSGVIMFLYHISVIWELIEFIRRLFTRK